MKHLKQFEIYSYYSIPVKVMDKMLDEYEKEQTLETHTWEQIQDIKLGLCVGFNYAVEHPEEVDKAKLKNNTKKYNL